MSSPGMLTTTLSLARYHVTFEALTHVGKGATFGLGGYRLGRLDACSEDGA